MKAQSYPLIEHVIMDGASSDRTVEIARRMLGPGDILVSEADGGLYDALNRGVRRASGDYILVLGADDRLFDADAIADSAAALAEADYPEVLYGGIEVRDPRGARSIFHPPPPDEALEFMVNGCLPHQATLAHKSVFAEKVGPFDERYRVQADYDWFLRCLAAPDMKIRSFRRVVATFSLGGMSSQLDKSQPDVYAIQNAFPLYQQPEWIEKRLSVFQDQTMRLRMRVQQLESASFAGGVAWLKLALRRLASWGGR